MPEPQAENIHGPHLTRGSELRSVAKSIEPLFPSAADLLRGIARELDSVPNPSTPSGGGGAR